MKNIITIFAVIAFSVNIFSQINNKNFSKINKGDTDKLISTNIQSGDEVSSKMSPLLNMLLKKVEVNKGLNLELKESGLQEVLFFYRNELDNLMVPVFIKLRDNSSADIISFYGGKYNQTAGNIFTAEVPLASIKQIAASPDVIYMEASTISKMKLDASIVETKVNQIHNGTGLPRSYKGNGVVVGVVDSGIDWKHQDFKNAGGSRIKYLWDMSGQVNPPSGYGYGTEYTKAQLDANQCAEIDGDDGGGHGTHVSGTAAGNGGASSTYTGMAPESEIIFVKGFRTQPGFASTDVVNGCNYIFQKSGGKPTAINLSLGGHSGAHDGSSLYEQSLSGLTGPGKIIVAAAGNEGGTPIHLGYTAQGTSYQQAYETFFELEYGASIVIADMWYTPGNISVGIAAYDTSNLQLIGYTNGIAPGQKIEDMAFSVGGNTYGWVTIDASAINNPNNGCNEVVFGIDSHNGQVNLGGVFWTVYTFGSGTFDAWTIAGGVFSTYAGQSWLKPGDDSKTVGIPSSANNVVCIGSYVTKDHWIDIDGVTRYQPGNPVIGKISSFSSLGPTRDNRIKPDICAPGEVIVAAYSSFLTQTPRPFIVQGGKHQKMQGTSMASPHVTGVVALMLEKNGTLTYSQTVDLLKNFSKKDGYTGTTPNNTYGSGKLDAYNSFTNTPGGGGGQTIILQEGFEGTFPPNGWSQQILNSANTWKMGNVTDHNFNQIDPTSQNSAICPWVAQNQNEWLITPAFNLDNGSASIEYYAGYSTQWLNAATLKLHISTDGGSNWIQLWAADNDGQAWIWRKKVIDLSSYSNKQNLKLGWQYIGNDGDIVGLDGIKLLGSVTDVNDELNQINSFVLEQNFPNPFNPSSSFRIQIPEQKYVKIVIFDIQGRKICELVNNELQAGVYEITWNGKNDEGVSVASGTYLYTLQAGDFIQTKKMMLIK